MFFPNFSFHNVFYLSSERVKIIIKKTCEKHEERQKKSHFIIVNYYFCEQRARAQKRPNYKGTLAFLGMHVLNMLSKMIF
jgi:hypothetical protein